ncbi:MAG: 50S ribosomal protein L15 [Nitrospirae bacterium]|nr:50S ribosomal protein L15 [Nitrospirota bacterium]MBI5694903.1 50S ribosomal protein L15 [Nitrospirota bacterium]
MKIEELGPRPGAKKDRKRVGRGDGSGHGKTSCRGEKGQRARAGGAKGPGFEGGQMPLMRRIPKRGFTNIFREEYALVNLRDLVNIKDTDTISPEMLFDLGLVKKMGAGIKVLAHGDIDRAITVQAHKFSESAVKKIEAAGGKAEVVAL